MSERDRHGEENRISDNERSRGLTNEPEGSEATIVIQERIREPSVDKLEEEGSQTDRTDIEREEEYEVHEGLLGRNVRLSFWNGDDEWNIRKAVERICNLVLLPPGFREGSLNILSGSAFYESFADKFMDDGHRFCAMEALG